MKNYIDENGDYRVIRWHKKDVHSQEKWTIVTKQTKKITFKTSNKYVLEGADATDVGVRLLAIGNKIFTVATNLNTAATEMGYFILKKQIVH